MCDECRRQVEDEEEKTKTRPSFTCDAFRNKTTRDYHLHTLKMIYLRPSWIGLAEKRSASWLIQWQRRTHSYIDIRIHGDDPRKHKHTHRPTQKPDISFLYSSFNKIIKFPYKIRMVRPRLDNSLSFAIISLLSSVSCSVVAWCWCGRWHVNVFVAE